MFDNTTFQGRRIGNTMRTQPKRLYRARYEPNTAGGLQPPPNLYFHLNSSKHNTCHVLSNTVKRDVEAKRQARKPREQDAAAAAAATKWPLGRPKGSVKKRSWTAAEKAFALSMLPVCGDNLEHHGGLPAVEECTGGMLQQRYWRNATAKAELDILDGSNSHSNCGRK